MSAALQEAVLGRVLPVADMLTWLADELAALLPQAEAGRSVPGDSGSSSSSNSSRSVSSISDGRAGASDVHETKDSNEQQLQQQQTVTKVLLAVLLARSVVALADAADPSAGSRAVLHDAAGCGHGSSSSNADIQQVADGVEAGYEVISAWVDWRDDVVDIVDTVHSTFRLLGLGTAAQPCSSNSSSSAGRVRWAYLLQLARSKKLAAAFDEMARAVCIFRAVGLIQSNPAQGDDQAATEHTAAAAQSRQQANDDDGQAASLVSEMHSAALRFCRVLAGAAPLPHLCNHLGCSSLAAGSTETAAAVKVCSGCGAWYCSAGCAAAHGRQHKKACRRMRALGLKVNR
jgi:hypothetical protein